MNKRETGSLYEQIVCRHLRKMGMQIIAGNYRCRIGEIDIIAQDGNDLVFIEVKYRSGRSCGDPLEAIDYRKQYVISRVAEQYLYAHFLPLTTNCRFDAASVTPEGIRYMKNAFSFIPRRMH